MTSKPDEAKAKTTKKMTGKRKLVWALIALVFVVVVLPLLLLAGAYMALRTDAGTAWVLEQVDGLEVRAGEGSLVGDWRADYLLWQGYGVRLELDSPRLAWSPTCLFRKTLCIDTLKAQTINLDLQPGDDEEVGESAETGPFQLPEVDLPIALAIGDVELGEFAVNGGLIWDTLRLEAQGSGSSVELQHVYFKRDTITVEAAGRVTMRGDWPLNLDVDTVLPPIDGKDWNLSLALAGSARDLRIEGSSSGYLDGDLSGRTAPLDPDLPARLTLESAEFLPLAALPPTLTLQDWNLALEGSLAKGFELDTNAHLPGARGAIELGLTGLVATTQAEDLVLTLSAPYHRQEKASDLKVVAGVDWSDPLSAEASFELQHFPWYDLLPDMEPLPVTVNTLSGVANYQDGQYDAELSAGIDGPTGETTLETELAGDMTEVSIKRLMVQTGPGRLEGDARISFAEQLAWQANLALERFNPGFWLPELEADLSGRVQTEGSLDEEGQPDLTAGWELAGTWQDNETRTHGSIAAEQNRWTLEDLELVVGDNRITGNGRWHDELSAALSLDLPDLAVFLPGLEGRLQGDIQAGGRPEQPTGQVSITGSNIGWQDQVAIASLDVAASITEDQSVQAKVMAQRIVAAGQEIREAGLDLSGTLEEHSLLVQVDHEQLATRLRFNGGWSEGWQGALAEGRIELVEQEQVWFLADPASLIYTAAGQVTLGQHCWQWQASSVCADDQSLAPVLALNYRLDNFPAQALAPVLPENLRWQTMINGQLVLDMTDAGPDGTIRLDAAPGEVSVLVEEDWEVFRYDTLNTEVVLNPEAADISLELAGPEMGRFTMAMTVDPVAEGRPVDGQFRLQGLDLALASAFVPFEDFGGEFNGEGTFNGPLMDPRLQGQLALTNGRLVDPSLPLAFKDLEVMLEFAGREAEIEGRWQSGEQGKGAIDGRLNWENEPLVRIDITGERLPLSYEPYARLDIAPDITVALEQGDLSITGKVDVPRGEIEVRRLPEQAVSVSGDEVVVGEQDGEPEEGGLQSLNMDVTVNVGEEEVSFSGFGVSGNLKGSLRIGNDMDTRGALRLVDGEYKAYGQELELRRARLVFVGPVSEPYLDIEAIRTVGSVTAGLRLSGPVSEPRTEVFSEPSMPESEALSYLVLGRPLRSSGDDGQLGQAALALGLAQTGGLTRGVGEELGIRDLTLEAEGSGDSASVVASGYISDKLSIRYGVGVFEPVTKVALRYDLGQYFYVEAASGLAASLDVFYSRDF
ncbi:translocation/assembly module TamB domain-containing protein [Marinobacter salicampi]|uniref:translocation/assembly module TamB domain-containing protein n=1 Tax=Marinobacter salicampi TaxID=435907 RepID=UPI001F5FCA9C|nr:translocation/assembly module TamB domain-containing protein [Marinobacter salicampi]